MFYDSSVNTIMLHYRACIALNVFKFQICLVYYFSTSLLSLLKNGFPCKGRHFSKDSKWCLIVLRAEQVIGTKHCRVKKGEIRSLYVKMFTEEDFRRQRQQEILHRVRAFEFSIVRYLLIVLDVCARQSLISRLQIDAFLGTVSNCKFKL